MLYSIYNNGIKLIYCTSKIKNYLIIFSLLKLNLSFQTIIFYFYIYYI